MNNNSIQHRFQSIVSLAIHLSCSLIELVGLLSIVALQITLTATETCAYRLAVGFWSFPFLCLAPVSLWLLVFRRDGLACVLALLSHLLSALFYTAILLVSCLVLLDPSSCSTTNGLLFPLNLSLIVVSFAMKVVLGVEMLLLWKLQRLDDTGLFDIDPSCEDKERRAHF